MAKTTTTRWRVGATRATRTVTAATTYTFERRRAGWQLPCGCIGPDILTSQTAGEGFCTFCARGWRHMTDWCHMLDGKPQGAPILILKDPI